MPRTPLRVERKTNHLCVCLRVCCDVHRLTEQKKRAIQHIPASPAPVYSSTLATPTPLSPVPAIASLTRAESGGGDGSDERATPDGVSGEREHVYSGSIDCAMHVIRRYGLRELYRGLKSAIVGMGVSSAVYFYWYSYFKEWFLSQTKQKTIAPLQNLMIASVAGIVNVFLTTPFWVVNTRMTVQKPGVKPEFDGLLDAFIKISKENKFIGFYRGVGPSIILGMCVLSVCVCCQSSD